MPYVLLAIRKTEISRRIGQFLNYSHFLLDMLYFLQEKWI